MLNSIISVDLHIHSKASSYKDGSIVENSDIVHLNTILDKLVESNIQLFSFSDHNRFDKNLYCAAEESIKNIEKYKCLTIIPTVEFDVQLEDKKPSCHIITVFDAKSNDDLEKIQNVINNNLLTKKEDFYKREIFEALLKEIGLSVLLIACQRKSLDNKNGGKNCLSDSCDNPLEFIKTGYINALEYQSPSVEGILNNSLVDLPKDMGVSLVAGSDCHEWSAYPYHDSKSIKNNKSSFFKIKSLPSFMGLVLAFSAPASRFKRKIKDKQYLESFEVNGVSYPLSSGFNVIIGENGSGKSTLLTGLANETTHKEQYMKLLLKKNNFILSARGALSIKHITQSLLVDNAYSKNSIFGDEISFKPINNAEFEKQFRNFGAAILSKINSNISFKQKLDGIKPLFFTIRPDMEEKDTFFIRINKADGFTKIENGFEKHLESINSILTSLKDEYKSPIYSLTAKNNIKAAFNHLQSVKTEITNKYLKIIHETRIKNIMSSLIDNYSTDSKNKSTTIDTEKTEYENSKSIFVDNIVSAIKEKRNNLLISVKEPFLPSNCGFSSTSNCGFDFISTTKYNSDGSYLSAFYKTVFNAGYQSLPDILAISEVSEAAKSVKGTGASSDYKTKLESNVENFIKDFEEEKYTVVETSSNQKMGNTLGEKAIVFYRYITRKCSDKYIYLIDQPEDNISNPKILSNLISYLSELRDRTQVIFITHNPLLVINLDVDNLIYLENHNGKIDVVSGCLEEEGILDIVAKNMDGGKEALRRRLKVYGN